MPARSATARAASTPDVSEVLTERGSHHRHQGLTDAQIRRELRDEGFKPADITRWLNDNKPSDEKPAAPAPPATPTPAASSSSSSKPASSSTRVSLPGGGSTAGVLLALVAYPAGLAYLQYGPTGLKAWFKAKFLNQTATDPGIKAELFAVPTAPGDGGNAAATVFTNPSGGGLQIARSGGKTKPPAEPKSSSHAGKGAAAAIAFARAQLGKPYKWGATGPAAFDCSGLVQAAWRAGGVNLPRTSYQMLTVGKKVTRANLAPGDLVWPDMGHVQLFIGGGQIIEAPHTNAFVRIMPLGPVLTARRVR